MEAPDTTVQNAGLWARYFEEQWGRWLRPFGRPAVLPEVVEGTAASVAGLLTMVVAGPIAWLYHTNAPFVSEVTRQPGERPAPVHEFGAEPYDETAA